MADDTTKTTDTQEQAAPESPVRIYENKEDAKQGQAQVANADPHDGKHYVNEVVVVTDKVITDASSDLAVQIPEGVGASTAGHASPFGEAIKRGTPQEQFDAGQDDADKAAKEEAKRAKA